MKPVNIKKKEEIYIFYYSVFSFNFIKIKAYIMLNIDENTMKTLFFLLFPTQFN